MLAIFAFAVQLYFVIPGCRGAERSTPSTAFRRL